MGIFFFCDKCDYSASRKALLKLHKESKHEGIKYPCDQCSLEFTYRAHLKQHIRSTHEGVRYSCKQCDYVSLWPQALKEHVDAVHEGNRYPCDKCRFRGKSRASLERHRLSKHVIITEEEFLAPETSGREVDHISIKQDVKESKHSCDQCKLTFKNPSSLKKHKESKHDKIRYPCDLCDYAATQRSSLKEHKEYKHQVASYPCNQCEYIARGKRHLKRHVESKHKGISFSCDLCEFTAANLLSLRLHERIHRRSNQPNNANQYIQTDLADVKLELEEYCDNSQVESKDFHIDIDKPNLTESNIKEEDELLKTPLITEPSEDKTAEDDLPEILVKDEDLSEEDIQTLFSTEVEDRDEQRDIEYGSEQHNCDYCSYTAASLSTLLKHKRCKHEGVRYPCGQCDYAATQRSSLKRHMESRHAAPKYPCM